MKCKIGGWVLRGGVWTALAVANHDKHSDRPGAAGRTSEMKTSMNRMVTGLGVGMVLASVGAAWGADYRRYYVPDYDQRRGAIFDVEGLPNNGAMYCVPTSAMNLMSYIAKRGFPLVPPSVGDFGPDADTAAYNELTNWLEVLGQQMGTDPEGGTGGEGAEAGITAFLESGAPGAFAVVRVYATEDFCPQPSHLAFHAITGGLVLQRFGWYDTEPGVNNFVREGGHVVTLNGLDDYDTATPRMRWRDPGSDEGNMFFQSEFTTNASDTLEMVGWYDGDARSQWLLSDYPPGVWAFIDGYIAIRPKFAVMPTLPQTGFGYVAPTPVTPDDPGRLTFDMPGGSTLGHMALGWDLLSVIATSQDPATGMFRFHRFSLGEPESQAILIALLLPAVQKISEAGGVLFVLADGSVRSYDVNERGDAELVAASDDVDGRDFLVWQRGFGAVAQVGVLTTSNDFVLLDGAMEIESRHTLPNAAALGTDATIQRGPDGSLWVFSGGKAYNYAFGSGPEMVAGEVLDINALTGSSGPVGRAQVMQNGRMHVSVGGVLKTLEKGTAGWASIPSQFAGMVASSQAWAIADSTTNFTPGVHDTEAWRDVFPTVFPDVEAECPWDLNKDGVTDFTDLNLVLNNWGHQGLIEDAGDATGDGAVTFEDLNLVLAHWGEGCE